MRDTFKYTEAMIAHVTNLEESGKFEASNARRLIVPTKNAISDAIVFMTMHGHVREMPTRV